MIARLKDSVCAKICKNERQWLLRKTKILVQSKLRLQVLKSMRIYFKKVRKHNIVKKNNQGTTLKAISLPTKMPEYKKCLKINKFMFLNQGWTLSNKMPKNMSELVGAKLRKMKVKISERVKNK